MADKVGAMLKKLMERVKPQEGATKGFGKLRPKSKGGIMNRLKKYVNAD